MNADKERVEVHRAGNGESQFSIDYGSSFDRRHAVISVVGKIRACGDDVSRNVRVVSNGPCCIARILHAHHGPAIENHLGDRGGIVRGVLLADAVVVGYLHITDRNGSGTGLIIDLTAPRSRNGEGLGGAVVLVMENHISVVGKLRPQNDLLRVRHRCRSVVKVIWFIGI